LMPCFLECWTILLYQGVNGNSENIPSPIY
jgi:hypothetical protein